MDGVLFGLASVGAVIGLGVLLAHIGMLDEAAQRTLSRLAFFVTVPALMLVTVSRTDVKELLSISLVALAAGIVVPATVYMVLAKRLWGRNLGEATIGAMSATYVNAGNLGIPIASYVLGNAAYMAPMLLFQLVIVQPICLALLDADARGRFSLVTMLVRPLRNPLTLSGFAGVLLAALQWRLPTAIEAPLELVGGMAVPSMLLAYGVGLRLGPRLAGEGNRGELFTTTLLKLVGQPLTAWFVAAEVLGIEGHALLVVVISSGLPTAQNIFVHALQHQRGVSLARDTILLTTLGAVPTMAVIAAALG
jgi:malonate transporter